MSFVRTHWSTTSSPLRRRTHRTAASPHINPAICLDIPCQVRGSKQTPRIIPVEVQLCFDKRGETVEKRENRTDSSGRVYLKTSARKRTEHCTAQHSTVQYSKVQHSTVQYSTAQYSTAQHNTAQYSTAQHNTAQHCSCISSTRKNKSESHKEAKNDKK